MHQIGLPYHWGAKGVSTGDSANDLTHLVLEPNVSIQEVKALTCDIRPGRRTRGPALREFVREYADGRASPTTPALSFRDGGVMSVDPPPARASGTIRPVGFFTDTSVCIGCKACEVACKQWNAVPDDGLSFSGMSYDNTVGLGASTWRHVEFIEQPGQPGHAARDCAG